MGCASSSPADGPAVTQLGEPAASAIVNGGGSDAANKAPPSPAAAAPASLPEPAAQPLFNGPTTGLAPVVVVTPSGLSAREPTRTLESGEKSVRSRAPRENDEESDWDQCSTNQFDLEGENAEQKAAEPALIDSVLEKVAHTLYAEQNIDYKETSTLRIDKVKGCMFVNQYLVVKFLGRGACGKVFLCLNTLDMRLYAMKTVRKVDLESAQSAQANAKKRNPMDDLKREIMIMRKMKHNHIVSAQSAQANAKKRNLMDDLKREIMIMRKMKHNHIVVLSEVIDDPAGSKLLLVMEFMEGGPVLTRDALEKREKLPESLALHYFRDMLKALDCLHTHKAVHGDLKPENEPPPQSTGGV
eukprot:gene15358-21443_t